MRERAFLALSGSERQRVEQVDALTDASQVVSEVTVAAPTSGVVINRTVNPGQVVSAGQDLFAVTDLSTVWVMGDLYEKDFPVVRVGSNAAITVPATDQMLQYMTSHS